MQVRPVTELAGAVGESDVCVTCTPSRRPVLMREHGRAGTFVAAVGADNPLKQELDPALMASSKVVVDILEQCAAVGDLHHAIAAGVMGKSDVYAEQGAIVAGRTPGRTPDEEVIIFDCTGTALQDVAAAAVVYRKALRAAVGVLGRPRGVVGLTTAPAREMLMWLSTHRTWRVSKCPRC